MRLALCLVVVTACQIDDDLVRCGDYLCPAGSLCDTAHESCATPEQFAVCANVDEYADCTANGIDGGCFGGVCLRRGCGNGIVEAGTEQCDDGNERSLDGCSSDCRSNETCGNGIRDPGEDCDDGGLLSKDGCDSRCLAEVGVWSEVPLGFDTSYGLVGNDEARQRLVAPGPVSTWELVDDAWQLASATPGDARAVYFDTVRNQLVAFVSEPAPATDMYRARAWDGTAWIPISEAIAGAPSHSTFDRKRGQPLVVIGGTIRTFDGAGVWSDYPTQPAGPMTVLAYDPANDELVSLYAFTGNEEYFAPDSGATSWTPRSQPIPGIHAIGLDGTTLVVNVNQQLYRRTGSGWTTSAAEDLPSPVPGSPIGLVYRRGATLVVERGVSRCRRTGSMWSCTSNPGNAGYGLVQDGDNHMRVIGGPYSWLVDEALGPRETVPSSPAGFMAARVAYAPVLRKIIASGTTPPCAPCLTETRVLDPSGWTLLNAEDAFLGALLYNPDAFGIVQQRNFDSAPYGFLDQSLSSWVPASMPDGGGFEYLVWDARLHHYVGVQIAPFTTFVFDLATDRVDRIWEQDEVAPRGDLTSDERTGSIVAVPPQYQNLTRLWERRAGIWTPRMRFPYEIAFVSSAYESDRGRLWVMGWASPRLVAFVHDYESPTPLETCAEETDADGDGRVSCDDADCYWAPACKPCLPFASCPGL